METRAMKPTIVLSAPQISAFTEDEKKLFQLKRQAIRHTLASLTKKALKIRRDRFLKKGARPGLLGLRGQTSALLDVYIMLKGRTACHGFNEHTQDSYEKWYPRYRDMFHNGDGPIKEKATDGETEDK